MKKKDLSGQPLPEGFDGTRTQEETTMPPVNMEYLSQLLDFMVAIKEEREFFATQLAELREIKENGIETGLSDSSKELLETSLINAANQASKTFTGAIIPTTEKAVRDICESQRAFKEQLTAFKAWCRRWLWYLVGAVIWALIVTVGLLAIFIKQKFLSP